MYKNIEKIDGVTLDYFIRSNIELGRDTIRLIEANEMCQKMIDIMSCTTIELLIKSYVIKKNKKKYANKITHKDLINKMRGHNLTTLIQDEKKLKKKLNITKIKPNKNEFTSNCEIHLNNSTILLIPDLEGARYSVLAKDKRSFETTTFNKGIKDFINDIISLIDTL